MLASNYSYIQEYTANNKQKQLLTNIKWISTFCLPDLANTFGYFISLRLFSFQPELMALTVATYLMEGWGIIQQCAKELQAITHYAILAGHGHQLCIWLKSRHTFSAEILWKMKAQYKSDTQMGVTAGRNHLMWRDRNLSRLTFSRNTGMASMTTDDDLGRASIM